MKMLENWTEPWPKGESWPEDADIVETEVGVSGQRLTIGEDGQPVWACLREDYPGGESE